MCCHGRTLSIFRVLGVALLLGGCRSPKGSPAAVDTTGAVDTKPSAAGVMPIKDPTTLVMAKSVWGDTLDPANNYGVDTEAIILNIYDTLIFYDGESTDSFIPWLATQVPSAENGLLRDDGKTYTFPIREKVTFQAGPVSGPNGKPFPGSGELWAEDVAYSFQRGMLAEPLGGPQWMFLSSLLGANTILDLARKIEEAGGGKKATEVTSIDDVSQATRDAVCQAAKAAVQVDGNSVVFHLPESNASFLAILVGSWGAVLDKEWVVAAIAGEAGRGKPGKKAGWDGDCSTWRAFYGRKAEESELYDATNGTGPFKVAHWVVNDSWTLQRHDAFWQGPAKLEKIINIQVPDFTARLLMYQNGDVDLLDILLENRDQIQPMLAQGRLRETKFPYGRDLTWFRFNQKVDPVRNGFIGSGKLDGEGIPPDFFSDIDVRKGFAYAFDVDTFIKERLLDTAVRATGPIHHGVFGFDPTWTAYPHDLNKAAEHFKKAFGGKLWDVGFTLVFVSDPALSLAANMEQINPKFRIVAETQAVDKFANTAADLVPLDVPTWYEDYHDPDNWVYPLLGGTGPFSSISDIAPDVQRQLDDLIHAARREQDRTKRAAFYGQIGRIAQDNALMTYGAEGIPIVYEAPYVKGVVYNPAYPGMYYWPIYKSND